MLLFVFSGCGSDDNPQSKIEESVEVVAPLSTPIPTSVPTAIPTAIVVATPTPIPTVTALPTPISTAIPIPVPTPIATPIPTLRPTATPIPISTPIPTSIPTPIPTSINYSTKFVNDENCNQIIDKEFLVICYDYMLKVAKSVSYTLYGDLVNELNIDDRPSFYVEQAIAPAYRATTKDYTHSGYDRGHLAPDASFDWSQESLDSTYSLANIIPQVPAVNRRMWIKAEKYERDKAVELFELNVVNVVEYNSTSTHIGENNISVSIGFYKILFNHDEDYEECFFYLNDLNASSKGDELKNHLIDCSKVRY